MISGKLSNSNAVEVDGVRFQTEIQSVIPIPVWPGTKYPVKLGIRVTNNTSSHLYFSRLGSLNLLPTLIDSSGNQIDIDVDMWRARVNGKPYYSVAPGANEFFDFESSLSRGFFRPPVAWSIFELQLKFYNEAGGYYYFRALKAGNYQLQILYRGSEQLPELLPEEKATGRVWAGMITIPFVEFQLGH